MSLRRLLIVSAALFCALNLTVGASAAPARWTGSWFTSEQLTEPYNLPPAPGIAHATLRQIIYPTLSGNTLRVTISNVFGNAPLVLTAAHIADAAGGDAIKPGTDHELRFSGKPGILIQPGTAMISDPLDMTVTAFRELAITLAIDSAPSNVTGHPGSRMTSYFVPGNHVAAERLENPKQTEHWYFLTELDVRTKPSAAAIVVLGDSITDGHASTTNANNRWPDDLARRLHANAATANIGVLNAGIGGNRLLRYGLGPCALARFDRDVLAPPGVRWVVVLEGINDIGTRKGAKPKGWPYASADDMITAYEQIITRAHAHHLRVIGATIMPYEGADFYYTPDGEAAREKVNHWIRTSGRFDAVIDFDAITRDPQHPKHLNPKVDSGDHLHPSVAGYQTMADAIDLKLFKR